MDNMTIEEEWLSQILGQETRKTYSRTLTNFKEFMEIDSTEELIKLRQSERNFETRIIQYYQWLQKEKGVSSNTARNYVIGLQSLFHYAGSALMLKNKLPKTHMKIENWKPSIEDLQKIFKLNDISVKAWMSLSRDVPARMSDLLRVTYDQIATGEFLLLSKKESVVGKCYTSEETKVLFEQLKSAKKILPRTQRGIDKMMDQACKVAGMPKRLNQHLWRKLFISSAINMGISEIIWKILTFKTIPQQDGTYYLDGSELRTFWEKIVGAISLESKANGRVGAVEQELAAMKETLTTLEKENMTLKVRVDNLQSNTTKLEDRIDEYSELLVSSVEMGNFTEEEKAAIRMKWNIREWTEEEREQIRTFSDLANELKNEKGEVNAEKFNRRFKAVLQKKEGDRKQ